MQWLDARREKVENRPVISRGKLRWEVAVAMARHGKREQDIYQLWVLQPEWCLELAKLLGQDEWVGGHRGSASMTHCENMSAAPTVWL